MTRSLAKKIAIIAGLLVLVVCYRAFRLDQYLTLAYLKESQAYFAGLYAARPLLVIAGYMALYIVVTALSLPGAAIMTLAGGGLFGLFTGTLVVSFASSIGATAACAVSRFLLRDWVQNRFGDRLATINEGIAREGAFYLFSLRLVPVFPFFVINLVLGLTRMPLVTYYWVSQLGMLPATIVFVNAGKELSKVESLSGILSPPLIASFALLGLFPLLVKKLLGWYKKRVP